MLIAICQLTTLLFVQIDEEMDENFLQESFRLLNVATTYIRVIRDRDTGAPLGYGFVGFDKEETAKSVLDTYNGTAVPNSGTVSTKSLPS